MPPFHETYKFLFEKEGPTKCIKAAMVVEEEQLPVIDLGKLWNGEGEECKEEIARASREWGFFQVINHGISKEILEKMTREQVKVFKQPFEKKKGKESRSYLNFSAGAYRWGTPTATSLCDLSWSEAFHIPMLDISDSPTLDTALSLTMEEFATRVADLAQKIAEILAEKLGCKSNFFQENCLPSTCYLRMNRYLPCPMSLQVFGLMPHTDTDFLTILHQDQVGGLQLVKDGKWIAVKPNPDGLIVNIGDLFQAWSNDVYKSVEHRVVANPFVERFSTAYFFCPSFETVVHSDSGEASVYRKFSFGEYKKQVEVDVKELGHKVGLPRFLV